MLTPSRANLTALTTMLGGLSKQQQHAYQHAVLRISYSTLDALAISDFVTG